MEIFRCCGKVNNKGNFCSKIFQNSDLGEFHELCMAFGSNDKKQTFMQLSRDQKVVLLTHFQLMNTKF